MITITDSKVAASQKFISKMELLAGVAYEDNVISGDKLDKIIDLVRYMESNRDFSKLCYFCASKNRKTCQHGNR